VVERASGSVDFFHKREKRVSCSPDTGRDRRLLETIMSGVPRREKKGGRKAEEGT